jgi:modulator of FtsH protease HflK
MRMSWNDSNNDQNPWGKRPNGNGGPPDLDQLVKQFLVKLNRFLGGKKPNLSSVSGSESTKGVGSFIGIIVAILLVLWVLSGIYIVGPAEQAVVLRLGKYNQTTGPGPHWIPRFIDSKTVLNVQTVSSFQFDADLLTKSTSDAEKPKQIVDLSEVEGVPEAKGDDTDKNVVHVELSVQYRISDPRLYLYNIVNVPQTLQQVSQSALSEVVGTMQLNDVLTIGRDQLALMVTKQVEKLMAQYNSGIEIVVVNVRKAAAPEEVVGAFLDVVQAGQDQQRYVQQAQAYASKVVPIAEGVQARVLADANAYQQKVVLNAQANIASYKAILNVYQQAPSITRERLYLDAMQTIMSNTSKVMVDTNSSNNLLYIPVDKLMQQRAIRSAASDARSVVNVNADEAVNSQALPSDDLYKAMYSQLDKSSSNTGDYS